MKKFTLFFSVFTFMMLVHSCEMNNTNTNKASELVLQPNDSLFAINDGGYNFKIILPKDLMISNTPRISVNGATGELNIRLGEEFWIVAVQEKTDITTIKNVINEDMLFTSHVIEETNNSLLVQRNLPDGTTYDYNFHSFGDVGGKPYLFKTSAEGEFSMESISRMKQAISSIHETV